MSGHAPRARTRKTSVLDLRASWQVTGERLDALRATGWDVGATSAKAGQGVEQAFERSARRMLLEP